MAADATRWKPSEPPSATRRGDRPANEAEAARENLRRTLYAADMGLVQAAWEGGRHREVTRLLQREKTENPDLLGFEWSYWMRQSHQAARTISLPVSTFTLFPEFSGDGSRFVTISGRVPVKLKGKPFSSGLINGTCGTWQAGESWPRSRFRRETESFAVLNHDGSRSGHRSLDQRRGNRQTRAPPDGG